MKELPHFADEKAEAEFWATHDSTEYLDNTEPVDVTFVDARVPKKLISVRFDNETIESLKTCLLYTSPSPRDGLLSRMPSSA